MARGAAGWPGSLTDRIGFERGARAAYPGLRGGPTKRTTGFRYVVIVDVPYYEPRVVTIIFPPSSRTSTVLADGPPDSPHRYEDGAAPPCSWHCRYGIVFVRETLLHPGTRSCGAVHVEARRGRVMRPSHHPGP